MPWSPGCALRCGPIPCWRAFVPAHISPRHLTRLFAEHAGIGVVAYQQRLRITRARQLLANRQLSVERVAELAGFASARDFRRVWQRHESNAPSRLRAGDGNERAAAYAERQQ